MSRFRCTCNRAGLCGWCEHRLEMIELRDSDPGELEAAIQQYEREYERWLDTIGGSR